METDIAVMWETGFPCTVSEIGFETIWFGLMEGNVRDGV